MNRDKISKFFEPQAKYREKMITRIYKGVPDMVRGRLWYILLDIEKIKEEQSGIYAKMRDIARRHSPDIRQVTNNFILLCIFNNRKFSDFWNSVIYVGEDFYL